MSCRAGLKVGLLGFALMAVLAWHGKGATDDRFAPLLAAIERESADERGYVEKAVNWALHKIGKRDPTLHAQSIACAQRIAATGTKAGRWIAADALKELEGEAVRRRVGV